jgi:peptide deformylase
MIILKKQELITTPCPDLMQIDQEMMDLLDQSTAYVNDPINNAAGLAGPQVGSNLRWFVAHIGSLRTSPTTKVYVNPRFYPVSNDKVLHEESCLSCKGRYVVSRHRHIVAKYRKVVISNGIASISKSSVIEEMSGWNAFVFQHEIDHLNGITIVDVGQPCVAELTTH